MLHSPSTLNVTLTEKAAEKVKLAMQKQNHPSPAFASMLQEEDAADSNMGLRSTTRQMAITSSTLTV